MRSRRQVRMPQASACQARKSSYSELPRGLDDFVRRLLLVFSDCASPKTARDIIHKGVLFPHQKVGLCAPPTSLPVAFSQQSCDSPMTAPRVGKCRPDVIKLTFRISRK